MHNPRYRMLRILSTVFSVFAWLALAWGLYSLATAQIADEVSSYYDGYGVRWTTEKGIGLIGALAIVAGAAVQFVVFMGISQLMRLLLCVEDAVEGLQVRMAEVGAAVTEAGVNQKRSAEHVRMIGTLVHELARRAVNE